MSHAARRARGDGAVRGRGRARRDRLRRREGGITRPRGPERRRQDDAVRRALGARATAVGAGPARRHRHHPCEPAASRPPRARAHVPTARALRRADRARAPRGRPPGARSAATARCFRDLRRAREPPDRRRGRGRRRASCRSSGSTTVADRPVVLLPLGHRPHRRDRAWPWPPSRAVVLLDEPTSGLDVHETAQIAAALRVGARPSGASPSSSSSTTSSSCSDCAERSPCSTSAR